MSKELMLRMATGSRVDADDAFSELVAEHSGPLTGFAFRRLRDWQQAEDIAQAVMLSVWQHAASYRDVSFTGWLYSIAKRKVIDAVRRRNGDVLVHRQNPTDDYDPLDACHVESRDPLDIMSDREEHDEIAAAMATVPDDQRTTLQLYVEGWSLPEIAEASGVPVATAKSRSRLAKIKVRERITL